MTVVGIIASEMLRVEPGGVRHCIAGASDGCSILTGYLLSPTVSTSFREQSSSGDALEGRTENVLALLTVGLI